MNSLLIGIAAGLSAGLFGIGGGVLVVPFLSWLFEAQRFQSESIMLMAVATSLATAIFTSGASVITHSRLGNVVWARTLSLGPSMLAGAFAGAVTAKYITADSLRVFFIGYLAYTGLRMAFPKRNTPSRYIKYRYLDYPIGFFIGTISALLGIGGGTMTVPYFASSGLSMKNAVATSSSCALPITTSAAVSYIILGWHNDYLPVGSLGYIYLPAFFGVIFTSMLSAPAGAKLAHRLPSLQLKRYFALIVLLIAIKMALSQGT
ncbi:MAG: sulfite exporter TauE/SafE family protein [Gammaproteobacteria bacterium]